MGHVCLYVCVIFFTVSGHKFPWTEIDSDTRNASSLPFFGPASQPAKCVLPWPIPAFSCTGRTGIAWGLMPLHFHKSPCRQKPMDLKADRWKFIEFPLLSLASFDKSPLRRKRSPLESFPKHDRHKSGTGNKSRYRDQTTGYWNFC